MSWLNGSAPKFTDQPDGRCMECKWSRAPEDGAVDCSCPFTHMTNMICLAKVQVCEIAMLRNDLQEFDGGY